MSSISLTVLVFVPVILVIGFSTKCCRGIIFPQDSRENEILLSKESVHFETENFLDENQKELKEDGVRWKGWNYLDTSKGWTPHEKTISFQFLDDDGQYAHAPPRWPHDEYFLQFPNPNFHSVKNETGTTISGTSSSDGTNEINESNKDYEWKKLHPRPTQSTQSMVIGPGFYNYGSSSNYINNNPQYTHQAITDASSSTVITSSDGQIPNSASESNNNGKFYPGTGNGFSYPDDYYRRKRLRLKIHPGLIAAPIAGFAAYKAVSAIAGKPLLFELGWVNNKPNIDIGGGWGGWNQQQPFYPPQVLPLANPYPLGYPVHVPVAFAPVGINQRPLIPKYPILQPKKKPNNQKSAWWNPFAALSPRFRIKKDDNCCSEQN